MVRWVLQTISLLTHVWVMRFSSYLFSPCGAFSHSWCKTTFLHSFLWFLLHLLQRRKSFYKRTTCRAVAPWKVCLKETVCMNLVCVKVSVCVCVCVSCRNSRSSSLTFPGHSVIKWLPCLPPPLVLFSLSFLPLWFSVSTSHPEEGNERGEGSFLQTAWRLIFTSELIKLLLLHVSCCFLNELWYCCTEVRNHFNTVYMWSAETSHTIYFCCLCPSNEELSFCL